MDKYLILKISMTIQVLARRFSKKKRMKSTRRMMVKSTRCSPCILLCQTPILSTI
jgi:hypothetical protein